MFIIQWPHVWTSHAQVHCRGMAPVIYSLCSVVPHARFKWILKTGMSWRQPIFITYGIRAGHVITTYYFSVHESCFDYIALEIKRCFRDNYPSQCFLWDLTMHIHYILTLMVLVTLLSFIYVYVSSKLLWNLLSCSPTNQGRESHIELGSFCLLSFRLLSFRLPSKIS